MIEAGIALPQIASGGTPPAQLVREFLARAETLGYPSAWVIDHALGPVSVLDPLELLTFAAALTQRMRLGSAVLLTALRSPVHLAKSLATLDHLSGGRLVVGVGLGEGSEIYPSLGLSPAGRAARFVEGLQVMKRLWTEERVSLDGRFFTLRDAVLEPKPTQKPHPPLWFGGRHPNALKRAVELGSGFIGGGASSTVRFGEAVRLLEPLLAAARRGPADFRVGKRVYVAIDHDRARAGRRLAEWFATFYGRAEMAADVAVFGGEQECLDGLAEVLRGGATFLILNPVFDELEHLERLAADIVPKL